MELEQEKLGHQTHKYYFDNIDILRGFAAVSVVIYHIIEHYNWTTFSNKWPLAWFRMGWVGVDIFFVISGFVITLAAFNQIDKKGHKGFFSSFMMRRIKRIVPLHYLTIAIFIVFVFPGLLFEDFYRNLLTHLLFIHNLFFKYQGSINGVNWSLGVEMQFYLLIALSARWLMKVQWWKIILCAFCISFAWRAGTIYLINIDEPGGPFKLFMLSTQLPGMLDEFAIGVLLARLIKTDFGQKIISGPKLYALYILIANIIVFVIAMVIYKKYGSFWDYPLMVIFFRAILAISAGLTVLFLCSVKFRPIVRFCLLPLYYLGTISYGIYLWHLPMILTVKKIDWLPINTAFITIMLLTFIFASFSWYTFERHFLIKK